MCALKTAIYIVRNCRDSGSHTNIDVDGLQIRVEIAAGTALVGSIQELRDGAKSHDFEPCGPASRNSNDLLTPPFPTQNLLCSTLYLHSYSLASNPIRLLTIWAFHITRLE